MGDRSRTGFFFNANEGLPEHGVFLQLLYCFPNFFSLEVFCFDNGDHIKFFLFLNLKSLVGCTCAHGVHVCALKLTRGGTTDERSIKGITYREV